MKYQTVMLTKTFPLFILASIMFLGSYAQIGQNSPFVRTPALNSDGTQIAFTYQNDIWLISSDGGQAERLTVNQCSDSRPIWSFDDSRIGFTSDRNGNSDIYSLGIKTGELIRHTFHNSYDVLSDWTANGNLIFTGNRFLKQIERENDMLKVSEKGGTPQRLIEALGYNPTISPDGKFIAFERGSCRYSREDYRGSANRDIWLYNNEDKSFLQLTTFNGNDYLPRWKDARTLLFISSREKNYNIFSLEIDDHGQPISTIKTITNYKEDAVRYYDISDDGNTIAFEKGSDIFIIDKKNNTKKLNITITKDTHFANTEYKKYSKEISEYAISPNGKYLAFIIHGNVFVKHNSKNITETRQMTFSSAREKDVAWLNDTTLLFSSDRENQYDLYLLQSKDKNTSNIYQAINIQTVRLTKNKEDDGDIVVSPNHKSIAYTSGNGNMYTANIEDNSLTNKKKLVEGWSPVSDITWSSDSKWLAYSQSDLDGNSEVFIHKADNSHNPVNISMYPRSDHSPVWCKDKLVFLSDRNNGNTDIWFVWLNENDWLTTKQEWKEKEIDTDNQNDTVDNIKIDFDNIYNRIEQVTSLPGNEYALEASKDGKTFYFVSNGNDRSSYNADKDIYSVKWDGTELKRLTTGNKRPYGITMSADKKNMYLLRSGGKLFKLTPATKKITPLPFAVNMKIDINGEREQIFEEAWRAINNGFYDPNFHNNSWDKLKAKWKPRAMEASTNADFQYCVNWMLGEINASHMGLYGIKPRYNTKRVATGMLGIDIKPLEKGVEIKKVLKKSPADRKESKLSAGDIITHIDGEEITQKDNYYSYLVNKTNTRVVLTVVTNNNTREVVIRPTTSIRNLLYDDWVAERRKLTEKYSNGRLGYIHIRGMNWTSFEEFEREIAVNAYNKEGLIVDVRYNGGGWTTDYLMNILNVKQHAYTIPRGAVDDLDKEHKKFESHYPFGSRLPFYAWTKPSITICNQNSYSNAEIFSHAYKTLGIGTLVGTTTFGAVISTGAKDLVDGSYIRLPFRAWYVKSTGVNMENNGAVPDIEVNNTPDCKAQNIDQQLQSSVEELLKEIDNK